MEKLEIPQDIINFIPELQLKTVTEYPDDYRTEIERLTRQIPEIPNEYPYPTEEEKQQKGSLNDCLTVHAHFFGGNNDFFVISRDIVNELVYCFSIIGGRDCGLGDQFLYDLTHINIIELDFHWEKCSLAQALYNKYPDEFPKPNNKMKNNEL